MINGYTIMREKFRKGALIKGAMKQNHAVKEESTILAIY